MGLEIRAPVVGDAAVCRLAESAWRWQACGLGIVSDYLPIIKVAARNSAEGDHGPRLFSAAPPRAELTHARPRWHERPRERFGSSGQLRPAFSVPAAGNRAEAAGAVVETRGPSAHLKLNTVSDWRALRVPGEGRRSRHWPRGAPVTVLAA